MILHMMKIRHHGKSSLPVQTSIKVAAASTVPTPVTLISRSVFQSLCSYTMSAGLVFKSTSTKTTAEETISAATETTKSTGTPSKATPITKTPIPIRTQTQMQTDSIHFRPIQTELATRFYFSLVLLVSYISYFVRRNLEKWMDHLLILTSLPNAEMLNCLMLSSKTQTSPFNLNLKNLEKWMDQLLILILVPGAANLIYWVLFITLPGAANLIYWVLFITPQICPFNLDLCTCKVDLVVMVGFSELRRDLSVIGDSLRLCCDLKNLSCNNHVSTFL